MNLANLSEVGRLSSALDYLASVKSALSDGSAIRIGKYDLEPGLRSSISEHVHVAIAGARAGIVQRLAELGVEVAPVGDPL